MHFGVIGAGVIGLTTAIELQREYPNSRVTILADKFGRDTTSNVAAGIFRPGTSFSGPTEEITRKWVADSYEYWDGIRRTAEASIAGVTELSGYIFSSIERANVRNALLENILPTYREATQAELELCPGDWKFGSFFTTVLTECNLYLPYALMKFKMNDGKAKVAEIKSFGDESLKEFNVVFNCTGLGSKKLANDRKLVPIRGQIIKVKAPWVKTAFYGDFDTYVIPGFESVTLGGCRQYDSYNLDLCKYDKMAIRERCENLLPSLVGAPVVKELVGLRPHRDIVRVEPEIIPQSNGKSLKIIHNYGHGGYGVTTAPGTCKYAISLTKDLLASNSKL